ncbi:hypothetical protein OC506_09780 [Vibrio vulnificus]|nr:hypothetical protein [Vibrio vulnificus]MCU8424146.1 hypothetical protein [Vibrio vulnificus]MCU8428151.1 hypothetical protein [Vibrio vulnificus]
MTGYHKLLVKITLANFVLVSLIVGVNWLSTLSALVASMVIAVIILRERQVHEVRAKQLDWIQQSMLPFQKQQLERSIGLSETAVGELLATIKICSSPLETSNTPSSLTSAQIEAIKGHQNRLITLLQYADTCHQLQHGVLELSEHYQSASLNALNEQQWQQSVVVLQQCLNDITNRTENASSSWSEGGEVIVFHEQGK